MTAEQHKEIMLLILQYGNWRWDTGYFDALGKRSDDSRQAANDLANRIEAALLAVPTGSDE
jgi:hypothetical protein